MSIGYDVLRITIKFYSLAFSVDIKVKELSMEQMMKFVVIFYMPLIKVFMIIVEERKFMIHRVL